MSNIQTIILKVISNINYILTFITLLLALVSYKYGNYIIQKLTKKFHKDNIFTELEKNTLDIIKYFKYLITILLLNLSTYFLNLPPKINYIKSQIFFFIYLFMSYKISFKLINIIFFRVKESRKNKEKNNEQKVILDTYLELLTKGTKIILIIILLLSACKNLELDILTLIASLGIGSLAVGLATQDTIKNFISGLLIASDRPFRLGDYIKIYGTDIEGHVVDIGVRTTKILTLDNNVIIIPNSTLTEKPIENLHYPTPLIKGRVKIGVAYNSNIELVKKAIWEAISEIKTILDVPKPSINLVGFGDSSLNFLVLLYVGSRDVLWSSQNKLREKILGKFKKYNIKIPFSSRIFGLKMICK